MQFWKMDIYYRMVTSNEPPASRPYTDEENHKKEKEGNVIGYIQSELEVEFNYYRQPTVIYCCTILFRGKQRSKS